MNTLSKTALGLLSSGVAGLGLYLKFWMSGFSSEERAAIEGLGISTKSCNASEKSCTLKTAEHQNINFSDGTNNDLKIPSDKTVKLNIEKPEGEEAKVFDNGMKFNLIFPGGNGDIEIQGSNNNNKKITLKPNTNYEFKKNTGGQLERAWKSGEEIAKKIGFEENSFVGNKKSLPFWVTGGKSKAQTVNIIDDNGKKFNNLTPKTEHKSKNLELNENQEGYNNGFKITTPEEIQFEPQNGTEIKLEKGKGYEILFIEDDWYLSKKK